MSGLEAVLASHAGCIVNAGPDNSGSGQTGVDVWSCGMRLPFVDDLDAAESAHFAAAIRAHLLSDEVVERAAQAAHAHNLGIMSGAEQVSLHSDIRAALRAATEDAATSGGGRGGAE